MANKKALIIGGTGILQKAVLHILAQGYDVTLIARDPRKATALKTKTSTASIDFVAVDYHDTQTLMDAVKQNGPFDKVICWMHSSAAKSFEALVQYLSMAQAGIPLYHVKGSAHVRAELTQSSHIDTTGIVYHDIVLGFKMDGGASRWLTNDEIANGVIASLDTGEHRIVIGQIEPWGQRPSY